MSDPIRILVASGFAAICLNVAALRGAPENFDRLNSEIRDAHGAISYLQDKDLPSEAARRLEKAEEELEEIVSILLDVRDGQLNDSANVHRDISLSTLDLQRIRYEVDHIIGRINALTYVYGDHDTELDGRPQRPTTMPENLSTSSFTSFRGANKTGIESSPCTRIRDINPIYHKFRPPCSSRVTFVGAGNRHRNPFEAIRSASNGEFIVIEEGVYKCHGSPFHHKSGNALIEKNVAIIGKGDVTFDIGYVHKGCMTTRGRGNTPDWLYVENIRFTGAHNGDFNGAGIRHVPNAGNLTIVGSHFEGNQNGVMGGGGPGTFVRIHDSTFIGNGHGDGRAHGIYINAADEFIVTDSTFKDQFVGHHIKSLATKRTIVRNSVIDDAGGNASMNVDVTAGGDVLLENNLIVQSAKSDNRHIIWYHTKRGPQGAHTPAGEIMLRGNEITNKHDPATLVGAPIDLDGLTLTLENNTINDPTGQIEIATVAYTSTGNTLNGEPMQDGRVNPDWPYMPEDISYPQYVLDAIGVEVPRPDPRQTWMTGVYRIGGGKITLEGTSKRDVLDATGRGSQTLKGMDGDDVYLPFGYHEIVEAPNEGFDWVLESSPSNASYLPDHIEGLIIYADGGETNLVGNDLDNVIIGGLDGGDTLKGEGGDDIFYKPVVGGAVVGGSGIDTLIMPCASTDAEWSDGGDWYPNVSCGREASITYRSIERVVFSDKTMQPTNQ